MICHDCGMKHGTEPSHDPTWHIDTCDWCGQEKPVTEERDYRIRKESK